MRNIILQHWTGKMDELGTLSSANIQNYAKTVDAEYELIRGDAFRSQLKVPWPPVQKLAMLNESYDKYDTVVMLDIDMFVRKGMTENVFYDLDGVGMHDAIQRRLLQSRKAGKYSDLHAPWWGGAIYKLDRKLRQQLREHIRESEIDYFCDRKLGGDEGLMHRLASLANINPKGTYFPDNRWCYCSYRDNLENAAMIHIRTKITPTGPKRLKIENYRDLVERGLIE